MDRITEFYIWRLYKDYAWGNELIEWGVRDSQYEMFIEFVPEFIGSTIDRDMKEIQDYIDEFLPDKNYIFEYQEFTVGFNYKKWKVK